MFRVVVAGVLLFFPGAFVTFLADPTQRTHTLTFPRPIFDVALTTIRTPIRFHAPTNSSHRLRAAVVCARARTFRAEIAHVAIWLTRPKDPLPQPLPRRFSLHPLFTYYAPAAAVARGLSGPESAPSAPKSRNSSHCCCWPLRRAPDQTGL